MDLHLLGLILAIPALIALSFIVAPGQWLTDHGQHLLNDVATVVLIITVLLVVAFLW